MLKKLLLLTLLLLTAACQPKHIDPPVFISVEALRAEAIMENGFVTIPVANTHSMEPVIWAGDLLLVAPVPFKQVQLGQIIGCNPQWNPAIFEVHRVTIIDREGLGVEGDNVDAEHPENKYRVTGQNYIGTVTGIYHVTGKP